MALKPSFIQKLWREIKRRKVHRVLAIYAGTAFIILEAADIIFPRLGLPDWSVNLVLYLLILGAFITIIVSWIYDITPSGIVRTDEVAPEQPGTGDSENTKTRQRTSNIIIGVLIVVVGLLVYPKIFKRDGSPLAGAQKNSIAVLPLKIIGDQADLNFLASGLVETLTYMLTKVGNSQQLFSVTPASEVMESITAMEARKRFGVTMVISGSIQMEGNTGRIILNLINTKKQQLVKSEKLDYRKENNFVLQDEAIKIIVDMLGLDMASITESLLTSTGSDSFEANELYLIGKGILREGIETVNDIDTAIDLFNLALKKDSTFALAYSGIAGANILKYHFTSDNDFIEEAVTNGLRAYKKNDRDPEILRTYAGALTEKGDYFTADSIYHLSLELDSMNPRLFADLGYFYSIQGKPGLAEDNYLKAVRLNPANYVSLYELGAFYYSENRFDDALREMKRAAELAPGHLTILYGLGICYFSLENIDEALKTFQSINEIDSTQSHILQNIGTCYLFKGDHESAAAYYTRALSYNPDFHALHGLTGLAYYVMEQKEQADEFFREAISHARENPDYSFDRSVATYYGLMGMTDSAYYYLNNCEITDDPLDQDPVSAFMFGELLLILGEKDKAFNYIASALQRGYGWIEVKYHPLFNDLRDDPGFKSLLTRADSLRN
ncbi:MAG: tetratricopeptide repeat protein [Bacteroidales bacterium]|nr:tetratricopeptide repeat protein [Bacteroidales bacterium]